MGGKGSMLTPTIEQELMTNEINSNILNTFIFKLNPKYQKRKYISVSG